MPEWLLKSMLYGGIAGAVIGFVAEQIAESLSRRYENNADPFDTIRPWLDAQYKKHTPRWLPRVFLNKYDRYMHLPYFDVLVFTARLGYVCAIPAGLAYVALKVG